MIFLKDFVYLHTITFKRVCFELLISYYTKNIYYTEHITYCRIPKYELKKCLRNY